jgi:hypothetical protein
MFSKNFKHKKSRFFTLILFGIIFILANSCNDKSNTSLKKFSFDDDGMVLIKGERNFIIGSYHLPKTANPFNTLATNGYNYVRAKGISEMEAANKEGLFTWFYTGSVNSNKKEEDTKKISDLVNKFKEHPSLLFWEIEDEPAFTWNSAEARIQPEQMQNTYNLIKNLDSEHLIITNHGPVNLISTLQKYNSSCDLVACDVYPVIPNGIKPSYALFPDGLQGDLLNPYISQVGEYVDKMKKVVHNSKPIFMVLQGFSWEMLKEESERDTTMILYPSYKQSRFMAYNAIVHGANGIIYWGTNYTPQPSPFINDLNYVTKELAEIREVLAARSIDLDIEIKYHELMYSVDAGVEFITKKIGNETYLISVNSDKNPVKVTFLGLDKFKEISIFKEDRNIAFDDGGFTDYYEPFDVHIYILN